MSDAPTPGLSWPSTGERETLMTGVTVAIHFVSSVILGLWTMTICSGTCVEIISSATSVMLMALTSIMSKFCVGVSSKLVKVNTTSQIKFGDAVGI